MQWLHFVWLLRQFLNLYYNAIQANNMAKMSKLKNTVNMQFHKHGDT